MLKKHLAIVLTALVVVAAVATSVAGFKVLNLSLPNQYLSLGTAVPNVITDTVELPVAAVPKLDSATQPTPTTAPPAQPSATTPPAQPTQSGGSVAELAAYTGPNYIHTEGSKLIDSAGREVTITGIAWFGMETGNFAPHGLWARSLDDMLDQIATLGYNTIRLPYSDQLFDPASVPSGINFEMNPDLKGLTGLQIMDKVVEGAGKRGLKIILDRHRPDANAQSNLWYTDHVSEQKWIDDWVMLAKRYANTDVVIGADLHNEPHGEATWGSGDPKTDWRLAAEKCGNAILAVNPNLLIVVEGIEKCGDDGYWWGGNLMDVAKYPVELSVPNRVVYSPHDYGPGVSGQSWFSDPTFPNNLAGLWDKHWGYIAKQGIAPVMLGEFGGKSVGTDTEGVWQRTLVQYLKDNGISYTYWTINPNSGDTGGILADDWISVNLAKQELLSTYLAPQMPVTEPGSPAK
jgi:endoglucanase